MNFSVDEARLQQYLENANLQTTRFFKRSGYDLTNVPFMAEMLVEQAESGVQVHDEQNGPVRKIRISGRIQSMHKGKDWNVETEWATEDEQEAEFVTIYSTENENEDT